MITARDLLAAVRTAQAWPSNYVLARELGLREKDVSRWNTGANVPADAMALRLAELAGLDAAYVLASMHAQRCTDEALRPVLATIAERARAVAALLLAVMVSVLCAWPTAAESAVVARGYGAAGWSAQHLTRFMIGAVRAMLARVRSALQGRPAAPIQGVTCCT
jgi:hypothetical protein